MMWPRRIEHPDWCGQGHHCSAEHDREHASVPQVWKSDSGKVVATRHQTVDGEAYVTLWLTVPLPAGDDQARRLGGKLITAALEVAGTVLGR